MARTSTACVAAPRSREVRNRYKAMPGSAVEGELLRQHLSLVKTVVGRIAMTLPPHVDLDDLNSAGVIGLLNALRNFDEANGAKFETYARVRIHGAVMDELRRMDFVSRGIRDKARRVQSVMAELEQDHGRVPTEEEMAGALEISLDDYYSLLDEVRPVTFICLDAVAGRDGEDGPEQYEGVADPCQESPVDGAARRELAELIATRIQQLPEMQRKVLALYYFEDLRLREIAEAFGVTESRICQIHAQAILAIKSWLRRQDGKVRE